MANAFEELRQRLDKKERELMINADTYMDKNVSEIDSYIRLINGRCVNLNSTVDQIKTQIQQSDEIELMNFYSNNQKKILSAVIESDLPQLKEIPK